MSNSEDSDYSYICKNSLISINIISDDNSNNKYSKYLIRLENSDESLAFKICKNPLVEYNDLTESFFYIRDIEECKSNYGINGNKNENNEITSKELRFIKKDKISQSTQFYLQHMISRKFISTQIILHNNKITLKLVNDIENAYPFSLKIINETRSSLELLTFRHIFYLNINIKEENQFYFVYEDELITDQIDNNKKYFDIILHKKALTKFSLINQTAMINQPNDIFSGQLINIIFSCNVNEKDEKFMLGVIEKKDNFILSEKNIDNKINEASNFKVVPFLFSENLYDHVLKKTFWVIEENPQIISESLDKEPIKIGEGFRIKNPLIGLYLNIKQKNINKVSNNANKSFLNDNEKNEYEFNLVDNKTLNDNLFFENNFKFIHYIISDENKYVVNDGKYILKSIFKNFNKDFMLQNQPKNEIFYYLDMESYYLSISLSFSSPNITTINTNIGINKNSLINEKISKKEFIIKNEDDFVFNINKIDILKGNEVIFIQKIILKLEKDLKNQIININVLNDWIAFLIEYLINLEYSYKDNDHETNVPIKERQILLWKFNVINIIQNAINFYLNNIDNMENNEQLNKKKMKLLLNIIRFLLYLSKDQENIKISIYIYLLNQIVEFAELLSDDYTKLLYFIFELINDSEILQNYLLGDSSFLMKYIQNDPIFSKMNININNLIKINKILDFIEINENFLLLYQKLINLNKVQYKKEEIVTIINSHIEQVKFKEQNEIDSNDDNYIKRMKDSINNAKSIIKNHVILLDIFINTKLEGLRARKTKLRNTLMIKNMDFPFLLNKKGSLKKDKNINSNLERKRSRKKASIESKIFEIDENSSQNPTIKSIQPLISNEDTDNYTKRNILSNFSSKDSERQELIESQNLRKSTDLRSFKNTLKNNSKVLKTISNRKSLRLISNHLKMDKPDKEKLEDDTNKKNKNDKQDYKNALNKLGKIWYFIKWYETFDFNYSLFIHNNFLKEIFNDKVKDEFIERQLFYFLNGKMKTSVFIKDVKINTDSKTGILYLFRLYNSLFPKINCLYENKIKNNENLNALEILEDMKEKSELDEEFEEYRENEEEYKSILFRHSKELDDYLCSFYSSYQFYINQYVKIAHRIFFILSNCFLNSNSFGNLKIIRECFNNTLHLLLSKVIFMEDNILVYLYSKIKLSPSIISGSIDLDAIKKKSIQLLSNARKINKNIEPTSFFNKDKNLIDYLLVMCQECDEIKYLFEKITIFKFIRNLFFSKEIKEKIGNEEYYNIEIEKQIKTILESMITKKKVPILQLYEKFNNSKNNELTLEEKSKIGVNSSNYILGDKSDSWSNYFYEVFKVGKITDFVTESLKKYEIKEFFNNIIYVDNNDNFISHDDKIVKKIRKIIDQFSEIENDILKLKLNSINPSKFINNNKESNEIFENLYRHVAQIRNESLECFNFDIYNFSSQSILFKMLEQENKTFYEKIHFIETFKFMINALNYYKNENDVNILKYISNLLRIFSKIKNLYPKFNKTIQENYEIYKSLILNSFQSISDFPTPLIDLKVETIFLNIFYYGIEAFLYILRNCKMPFLKIKEFMEKFFEILLELAYQYKTKKNKLIYQILYLFTVSRVLLFLNTEKTYDFYTYNIFYKKIFPIMEINKLFFSNLNYEEKKNGELIDNKNIINEKEEISMDKNDDLNKKKLDFSLINLNAFPVEMQTYKLENHDDNIVNDEKNNNISKIETKNSINHFNEQDSKLSDESSEWSDKDEMKILNFYSSFLFVYNLYLNEKNSIQKENEEVTDEKNKSDELSLNSLFKKLQSFLSCQDNDKYILNNNISIKNKEIKESFIDSYMTNSREIEEKTEMQEDNKLIKKNNNAGYLFIFSLFQAIVNFQDISKKKDIEIPINQNNFINENDNKSQIEELIDIESDIFLTNKKRNSIIFYYYDSEYIDIILSEKIINEISIKNHLKNYCLELADYDNNLIPEILKLFFKSQEYYSLISNYYKNEYNIINNLYIKNNMSYLIKKIINDFNQDDFSEIEFMKNFLYTKMGEIYNHEIIKGDELEQKNINLIDYFNSCEEKNGLHFSKINLVTFLDSLKYIYPKYEKKICLLYYKIGFEILYSKISLINNKQNDLENDLQEQTNLESTIKLVTFLFNRKSNRILLEDKYVFNSMLLSMRELYKYIINNSAFIIKHFEIIKEYLSSLDFILGHLSKDFEKIVNFMRRPENLDDSHKFNKQKIKLETTLDFFISLINFKKIYEEIVLNEEIKKFANEIIERSIKLLFLLIVINKNKSIEIMNILLNYIFEFIKGPDIENLNLLCSLGFLDLVSFVIINVDYYKLFLSYLNKENKNEIIDNFSKIECRIIKIFIAYYNISYSPYSNMAEFKKLKHWYEINFKHIKKKLKKIFYISEKEMENRQYIINKMLLFIKEDDKYSYDELYKRTGTLISDDNDNEDDKNTDNLNDIGIIENRDKINDDNEIKESRDKINDNSQNNFCIIKFDLLISYYTLFNYHKDLSDKEERNALMEIKKRKNNMFYWILNFFIDFVLFLIKLIIVLLCFWHFIFQRFSYKIKKDVDLLQDLSEIEVKCENYSENKIINFLKNYIREVEVSVKNVIYKVYFPMIDKANTLLSYRKEYLEDDQIDSTDFTNSLLSNYDYINIRAKQNALINIWIDEFPIFNYIFKNMYIYGVLLIILGLSSNILIICSFSTFLDEDENCDNYYNAGKNSTRLQCPHLFYKKENSKKKIRTAINVLEIIELILQGLTFFDYLIRKLAVESEITKLNYDICNLKNFRKKIKLKVNKYKYILYIAIPTIIRCFLDFQTIYYIISILFLILGIALHPFFNCIILLEFVNRIQLMQTILKAMYKPIKNILITLLMFIILEYLFSFFAVSNFETHFPHESDTSNFLKTFMRMMDQTFKQDGGIGTYLDKSLDENYVPYTGPAYFNVRFFFDLLFFLVILLLIFQMFLSIIIDYFNETRENSENFEDELETTCIVCGIDREEIEKINSNDKNAFDKHITYYHNVFNYIYYLMYLQSSSMRDVIIDNSVWNLHLVKNLSYLPKNTCFKQLEKNILEEIESK